jgi:stage II sporulation protein D
MKRIHFASFTGLLTLLALSASAVNSKSAPWFGAGATKAEVVDVQLPVTIKVALIRGRSGIVVIGSSAGLTYSSAKLKKPVSLGAKSHLKIYGGKKGITVGGKSLNATVRVKATEPEGHLILNGRAYRGSLIVRPRGHAVDVIEEVGLEEYLNGVLPREVGADWPPESLKAQAVISRTFVVANIGRNAAKGYDVSSDVYSQVYGGLQDEQPATNQAVADTRGEILLDDKNAPVLTFFHSSCGGRTENPRYVWQDLKDPPAYLDSVKDPYCKDDPFINWEYTVTADRLQKRLRHAGYKVGVLKNISIDKSSPSGRAWSFKVESTKGSMLVPGNSFRLAVGADELRSTLLSEVRRQGKSFHFEGHGWGHGVGLCQWGARGRAAEGHSYGKILDAYYAGAKLVKATEHP